MNITRIDKISIFAETDQGYCEIAYSTPNATMTVTEGYDDSPTI